MSGVDIFKMDVRQFNNIEIEIKTITKHMKPYNDKLKELKLKKKDLELKICDYMSQNEIDHCKLEDGSLTHQEKKTIVPLKKKDIKDIITNFFNNYYNDEFIKLSSLEKSDILFDFIYKENREFIEKSVLNRN